MPELEAVLYDVFISYSDDDRAAVLRIVEKLREQDLSVWHAHFDVRSGEPFVQRVSEGLRTSQVVVTFLSPSAIDSFWVEAEWSARLIQMSRDRTRRLIPVLIHEIEDEQIPLLLQPLNHLDFRNVDLSSPAALQEVSEELARDIRKELPSPEKKVIGIPFVVFAMTKDEAEGIISRQAFDGEGSLVLQRFEGLLEHLAKHGRDDILKFYGDTRDDWRPPIADGVSFRDILENVLRQVNEDRQAMSSQPVIQPQFFSTDFFSDDENWRNQTWNELDESGYILVIDAVSWFHPRLRWKLERSGSPFSRRSKNISILVLSPIGFDTLEIVSFLEEEVRPEMPRIFERFADELDIFCEFGVGSLHTLKRWLYTALPKTALNVQGLIADPVQKQRTRQRFEEVVGPATGMDQVVIG